MRTTHALEVDLDLRVTAAEEISDGVIKLTLEREDRGTLPDWTPGSHIDLRFGAELVRQYSLCGDVANADTWQVAVLREPLSRGGSTFAHDSIASAITWPREGRETNLRSWRAPRNTSSSPVESESPRCSR
ncbi:hypothetical protein [Cryobacterium sp. Hh7]|uniref:hypothetical protein n=1 Tax=Cryobacterium sp. Hh7 TaxID=1259159 RepID=UPI0018E0884C|nr:hypothetical protein [Cryobacterium sp. Hh7]